MTKETRIHEIRTGGKGLILKRGVEINHRDTEPQRIREPQTIDARRTDHPMGDSFKGQSHALWAFISASVPRCLRGSTSEFTLIESCCVARLQNPPRHRGVATSVAGRRRFNTVTVPHNTAQSPTAIRISSAFGEKMRK